ncbi:hypothetical protein DL93DRAFT_2134010 [Clavulina sp. PMI_390]|nr:hypothetical protein DL93DRAFT_2134010 [Clavulina sp. PMI_390]
MKHLLSSIESRALDLSHTNVDISQLLTNVRDTRDLKSVEGFTEAMEKVLHELRSTEHAAPFLKPVKRQEAPGYDAVIREPMDLGTMARKVKQHTYKNKREFVYDLNLIWDNCLTYNSEPTHPLRRTTVLMQQKAESVVEKHLGGFGFGDSRTTPLPPLSINGLHNNHHHPHHLTNGNTSPTIDTNHRIRIKLQTPKTSSSKHKGDTTIYIDGERPEALTNGHHKHSLSPVDKKPHRVKKVSRASVSSFEDSPAIIRTSQSMQQYYDLDYAMQRHLDSAGAGPSKPSRHQPAALGLGSSQAGFLIMHEQGSNRDELRAQLEDASKVGASGDGILSQAYQECLTTGVIRSLKRMPQPDSQSPRASKRRKISLSPQQIEVQASLARDNELLGAWWGAMTSTTFLGNGAPALTNTGLHETSQSLVHGKKRGKRQKLLPPKPKDMRGLRGTVFKNVDTLRRIRRTGDFGHALGEDFFGLRALGLEKELGLTSLSVPARLFHGRAKKDANRNGNGMGAPKEPSLPFPPPQPFIPLSSHRLDGQIGLLRGFYRNKFDRLRDVSGVPDPAAPTGSDTTVSAVRPPFDYPSAPPLSLVDDQPSLLRQKMGPNGQVTVPTSAAAASAAARKKKAAAADTSGGGSSVVKPKPGATATKGPAKKKPAKTSPKKPSLGGQGHPLQPQAPAILAS